MTKWTEKNLDFFSVDRTPKCLMGGTASCHTILNIKSCLYMRAYKIRRIFMHNEIHNTYINVTKYIKCEKSIVFFLAPCLLSCVYCFWQQYP